MEIVHDLNRVQLNDLAEVFDPDHLPALPVGEVTIDLRNILPIVVLRYCVDEIGEVTELSVLLWCLVLLDSIQFFLEEVLHV